MNTPNTKTGGMLRRLSSTLLSSVVLLALSLLGSKAIAQVADYVGTGGTSTSITYYSNESGSVLQKTGFGTATPCSSGGLSGMTNNGVTTYSATNAHVYFKVTPNAGYQINVTSFTAKLRRSGSGLQKVRFAYSLDNGSTWTDDGTDHGPNNSSCGSSATTLSWAGGSLPTGITSTTDGIIIALYPFDPITSGGVIQVNEVHIGGSITATSCSGTPSAGTASATPSSICGSGTSVLSLAGASGGSGITYQWAESSTSGGVYTNIPGATTTPYTTGTISATTYYKATVTCTTSGLSATTAYTTVSVTPTPTVAAITGTTDMSTSSTTTLSNATPGGVWASSNTGVATIGTSGVVSSTTNSGITTISYTVTTSGCSNTATVNITSLEPGTLAVYSGTGGNGLGTSVIAAQANETAGALTQTGFGTATPCGSGGLSGMTVNTVVATYGSTSPHIYYQILPNPGFQLNVTNIKAVTRESSTGPQQARIAYSLDGGSTWTDEGADHAQSTGGSCGAASNIFSYTGGLSVVGITSTVNGIVVAVYPYNPSANGGVFQLHHLTVFGNVAPAGSCTGTVGGTATASPALLCGSGTSTVTLTGGSAATGITYQWQQSSDGISFSNILGATNTIYNTSTLTSTTYYQVVTTCAFGGTPSTSTVTVASVNPVPSAGTITGVPSYIYIGTPATLSNATGSGVWTSLHTGVATVGSASGTVTGLIPGTATIKYTVTAGGCSSFTTADVNVLHPNTIAAYLGTGGSSVSTIAFTGVTTTTLTATGFGANTPCGSGGLSGLTVSTTVATYSTSGPNVAFKVTADAGSYFDVTGFHATLRRSTSGISKVRMAYSLDNGATWNDDAVDQAPDNASCAQSSTDFAYATSLPTGVVASSDGVIFALYAFGNLATGGTIQVNAIDIVGTSHDCVVAEEIIDGDVAICVGATAPLTGSPAGGTWSSSATGVATVGTSGVVTGVSEGVVTITYTITNLCGSSFVTTEISVNPLPEVDDISGESVICAGATTTLGDAVSGGVWASSDAGVATVGSASGDVTGVSAGTVTISYTVTSGAGCSTTVTFDMTVNATPSVPEIGCYNDLDICIDEEITLCGTPTGGTWSSSAPTVATVGSSDGLVTGVSLGATVITYTVTNEFGCSAYATVTVNVVECGGKSASSVNTVSVADIKLYPNPASSTLNIVATEKVNISVVSVDGKVLFNQNNASEINVSNLKSGIYMIRVYNQNNVMLKTLRFTKN